MRKLLFLVVCCLCLVGCNFDEGMEWLGFEKENGSTVSLNHSLYDSIKEGSSKEEIENLVGTSCDVYYESGNGEQIWCRFWDKDDSNKKIVLKFENSKLSSKSQSGL